MEARGEKGPQQRKQPEAAVILEFYFKQHGQLLEGVGQGHKVMLFGFGTHSPGTWEDTRYWGRIPSRGLQPKSGQAGGGRRRDTGPGGHPVMGSELGECGETQEHLPCEV